MAALFFLAYILIVINVSSDLTKISKNIYFWFNFLIYYQVLIIAKKEGIKLNIVLIIKSIIYYIIFESIIININFDSNILNPNSNELKVMLYDYGYERPLGHAGNATASSIQLIIIYLYAYVLKIIKFRSLITLSYILSILLLSSGTGFYSLIISILYIFIINNIFNPKTFIIILSLLIISLLLILNIDLNFNSKLSYEYLVIIFNDKYQQIHNLSNLNGLELFFGNQIADVPLATSGDFGWRILFTSLGTIGLISTIIFVITFYRSNRNNLGLIILFILLSIHYPAMYMAFGSLLFAMLLVGFSSEVHKTYE